MNRTTVSLEPGLLRCLKEEAARNGKTMQECLNEYVRLGLNAAERQKRGPSKWTLPNFSLGKPPVDPADRQSFLDWLDRD